MTLRLFIIFNLSCFSFNVQSQELAYDIIWLGKIGTLSINKTMEKDHSFIEINSEVKIPFYRFNWITSTTSRNGKLFASNYRQLLNNNKREFTEINYAFDSLWQMVNNDGQKHLIHIEHDFFVARLYFDEPLNEKYIFSERFGRPFELINKGNGNYRLLLPDDNYCEYFYENGICKKVIAKNGRRTFKMVLTGET